MTHTPGPWKTRSHRSNSYVSGGVDDSKEELWITVQTPGDDVRAANARLIAAAPELLDALYAALPYVEEGEEFNHPEKRDLSKTIRALIAKVEGQQ